MAIKMKRGDSAKHFAERFDVNPPEISLVGSGESAYLWIGGKGGPCYATLQGVELLKLAAQINKRKRVKKA